MRDDDAGRLVKLLDEPVQAHVPLSSYLTIRTGGPARLLLEARSACGVARAQEAACALGIPVLVIGNGSNMLVSDEGFDGLVIHFGSGFSDVSVDGCIVEAQAGALLPAVSKMVAEKGLSGLEFAVGIPGSLGGALVMNAGAFDSDMSGCVQSVTCLTKTGHIETLCGADLGYGYRTSRMLRESMTVLSARLRLAPGNRKDIKSRIDACQAVRRERQPLNLPSAGSFFKRPEGHYAGALIEQAGLKGMQVGGAAVSMLHAGFLVNMGDATSADFINLMRLVQDKVYAAFSIRLEPEVRIVGYDIP
jgi:UDP-N-acetylmuramate dehydrogenase